MQQARAVRSRETVAVNPTETETRLNGFVGRACEAAKVDDGRGWKQRPLLRGGEAGRLRVCKVEREGGRTRWW